MDETAEDDSGEEDEEEEESEEEDYAPKKNGKAKVKLFCRITYRISANSCRDNYSFFGLWVQQLFKGDNYLREETIK